MTPHRNKIYTFYKNIALDTEDIKNRKQTGRF